MREIQASEAKTKLPQLLDDVERGETLIITRHGKPIARLVPEEKSQQKTFDEVRAELMELRKHTGRATVAEILAWRHEGHKY
jgi:prevent-host-death family protein